MVVVEVGVTAVDKVPVVIVTVVGVSLAIDSTTSGSVVILSEPCVGMEDALEEVCVVVVGIAVAAVETIPGVFATEVVAPLVEVTPVILTG